MPFSTLSRFFCACLFLAALVFTGCDTTTPQPETQVVVEAYLRAGASLPRVRLSRTVGTEEQYDPTRSAVRDAEVSVHRLGERENEVPYVESDSLPGIYEPAGAHLVRPGTSYRLTVETPDGAEVTAETTVPGNIEVGEVHNERAVYQGPEQPTFTIDTPRNPDGRQNVFVFTTTSLLNFDQSPDSSLATHLTPLYASQYGGQEDDLDRFEVVYSGLLNEANYDRNADGTITISLPWVAVAFYGANEIAVNMVDDNLYDFLRTQQAQQGGFLAQQPGLGPGEIPNVLDHVEGGTGVFGSYVRVSQEVIILRPEGGDSQ